MDGVKSETWLDRLKVEYAEVKARYDKLDAFLLSDPFGALPVLDRTELCEQWRHMDGYVTVLERRIARGERQATEDLRQAQQQKRAQLHSEDKA